MWKCPGLPGPLPHRSRLTFSHIPTDRCAAGRTGAGADGPAVDSRQTHFWCVWLKIDSRAAKVSLENPPLRTWSEKKKLFLSRRWRRNATGGCATRCRSGGEAARSTRRAGRGAPRSGPRNEPAATAPAFAWDCLSSYTHRPLRSGAHGCGGRWAGGRFPTNPLLVRLAKNRLTSSKSQPREPAFSDSVETAHPGLGETRPGACLVPCRLPPTYHDAYPPPPSHQAAYPRPTKRPTPDLPSRLPPTYHAAYPPPAIPWEIDWVGKGQVRILCCPPPTRTTPPTPTVTARKDNTACHYTTKVERCAVKHLHSKPSLSMLNVVP